MQGTNKRCKNFGFPSLNWLFATNNLKSYGVIGCTCLSICHPTWKRELWGLNGELSMERCHTKKYIRRELTLWSSLAGQIDNYVRACTTQLIRTGPENATLNVKLLILQYYWKICSYAGLDNSGPWFFFLFNNVGHCLFHM